MADRLWLALEKKKEAVKEKERVQKEKGETLRMSVKVPRPEGAPRKGKRQREQERQVTQRKRRKTETLPEKPAEADGPTSSARARGFGPPHQSSIQWTPRRAEQTIEIPDSMEVEEVIFHSSSPAEKDAQTVAAEKDEGEDIPDDSTPGPGRPLPTPTIPPVPQLSPTSPPPHQEPEQEEPYNQAVLDYSGVPNAIAHKHMWNGSENRRPRRPPTVKEWSECGWTRASITLATLNDHLKKKHQKPPLGWKKVKCLTCGNGNLAPKNYREHSCVDLELEEKERIEGISIFVTCEWCRNKFYPPGLKAHRCKSKPAVPWKP